MSDPFAALESLGALAAYRSDSRGADSAAETVKDAIQALRREFDEKSSERDQFAHGLQVTKKLLEIIWRRSGECMSQHREVSCENVDFYYVPSEWIQFVEARLDVGGSPQA